MADYYWKGSSGGTATHSNVAANWMTTSGGSTAHTNAPGVGDNLFFDITATKPCEFTGSNAVFNNLTVKSTFPNTLSIIVDTYTITLTGIATFEKYGVLKSDSSGILGFVGVNSAGTNSTIYDNAPFLIFGSQEPTLSGIFHSEFDRQNFTVAVDLLHMDNQDMILLDGIYPNVSFLNSQPTTAPGKTFKPSADPSAYGNIQYSEVDMLNFSCAIPIKPGGTTAGTPAFDDYNKTYRIRGTLTLTDPTFFWGNTTLRLTPTAAGQFLPANGESTTYGGTGPTFAAKYNRIIIDANTDFPNYYFTIRAGLKLFCNKLEIRSNARLYGSVQAVGTHTSGAEIHCVSSPVVHGDWNFSQISRGVYRNTGTIPLLSHLYGGTGLSSVGTAGQVLAVNNDADGLLWSSTAGGGGVTVENAGSALNTTATTLDFTGNGVTASGSGAEKTITITDTNTVYTHPNHSGDVTSSGDGATTIAADAVTYAKMQNVSATNRILGRDSTGAGVVEEISPSSLRTMINVADGANNYSHPTGDGNLHVPATSTSNNGKVLTAGGTAGSLSWVTPNYLTLGNTSTTAMAGNTAVNDVSKANLITVLASLDENDTLNIGDAGDDTNVVIRGNLQVDGTTTTVNSTVVNIDDSIIKLHAAHSGGVVDVDAGLEIERGDGANKFFFWDEGSDRWTVGSETMVAGNFIGTLTGNVTGSVSGSSGSTTGNAATATHATKAANIAGGSVGKIPYQSAANTTALLAGNETTTKKFLTQTGDGTDPAAPAWGAIAAADVPTLNQNTTGTASTVTGATQSAITTVGNAFTITGSGSATLNITATDGGGSPAQTTFINMTGYETRAQGIRFFDEDASGEEWFAGLRYNGAFDEYTIGYDASGGESEYVANALLKINKNGNITATTFVGALTGNVTGNVSGTAATVTGAAQTNITSLGTLTALTGGTGDLIWDTPTFVVDSSANKVGIGTTSPLSKLDVVASLAPSSGTTFTYAETLKLNVADSGSDEGPAIRFRHGATNDHNAADYMFQVNGDDGAATAYEYAFNYGFSKWYLAGSADGSKPLMKFSAGGSGSAGNTMYGELLITSTATGWDVYDGNHTGLHPTTFDSQIRLSGGATSYINNGQNFGIGTASPGHKLHVSGPPDDAGDYAIYADEGSDNYAALVNRHSENRRTALFYRNINGSYTAKPMVEIHQDHSSDDQAALYIQQDGSGPALSVADTSTLGIILAGTATSDGVIADISFRNDADSIGAIQMHRVSNNSQGDMTFHTQPNGGNVTERMRIDSTGKVGIGEPSPSFPLHLKYTDTRTDPQGSGSSSGAGAIGGNAEGGGLYVENGSLANGVWSGISFRAGTADARIAYKYLGGPNSGDNEGYNEGQMSFYLDVSDGDPGVYTLQEVLRLRGGSTHANAATDYNLAYVNGRMGIGTTNPEDLLHISKGNLIFDQLGNQTSGNFTNHSKILFRDEADATTRTMASIGAPKTAWSNSHHALTFNTGNLSETSRGEDYDYSIERMRIDSTGKVGIGTSAPDTIFHISSAAHPSIRITGTDNANADPAIEMLGQGNSFVEGMQMWYDNGTGAAHIASLYDNSAADIQFHTRVAADRSTSNVRMVIEGDGNVGIGTTTPSALLHLKGASGEGMPLRLHRPHAGGANYGVGIEFVMGETGDASAERVYGELSMAMDGVNGNAAGGSAHDGYFAIRPSLDGTPTERMRVLSNGKVAIGSSSATATLDVTVVGSNTTTSGIAFGDANKGYLAAGSNFVSFATNDGTTRIAIDNGGDNVGNVGIGTTTPTHKLEVNGSFAATTKEFVIDHPTKPNMKLHHGSLEGPEHGVYIRGKNNSGTIHLPDYWEGLVDEDSITVQLTAIGKPQELFVREISNGKVRVATKSYGKHLNYFYFIQGERKDIDKLEVEECLE